MRIPPARYWWRCMTRAAFRYRTRAGSGASTICCKTQAADGSWHVVSRLHPPASVSPPYFESGYPYGHDQFLSALAADWAVMALARALGAGQESGAAGVEGRRAEWPGAVGGDGALRRRRSAEGAAGRRVRFEFGDQIGNHGADDGCARRREDETVDRSRRERERAREDRLFGADGGGAVWRECHAGDEPAAGPWRGSSGCRRTACSHVQCHSVFPGGVLRQHRDSSAAAPSRR